MTIEAVVFDIGNVLIEWQPERFFDREIGEARRRAFFAASDLHAMNDLVDQGEALGKVVADHAAAHPEWETEILMWESRWLELAGPEIPASVGLLRAVQQAGVPAYALSNFGKETFEMARPVYPFLDSFDRAYVSGYMGVTKPAAAIYRMVEEDCDVPPARLLFVDDRQENLDAAVARGWQTHLFDGAAGLRARLIKEGVLTA